MFFTKKQPDTVDLTQGTLEINGFQIDGWTTDELFLRIFGEDAAPSKKQATYVLRDTHARLNEIEFSSVMVQFSPLGFHRQRVTENVTLYVQPCKHSDFTKRILTKLPDVTPTVYTEYDLIAFYNGMKITARLDSSSLMASLNIEYLDSTSRVENWVRENMTEMVTPKSGAIKLFGNVWHANLRESTFKSEVMSSLTAPEQCAMDDSTMVYAFKNVDFYDLRCDIAFGFLDGKLASIKVIPFDAENMMAWAGKNFGKAVSDENAYFYFKTRAAGAREWYIRVYKHEPRMEWLLKMAKYA